MWKQSSGSPTREWDQKALVSLPSTRFDACSTAVISRDACSYYHGLGCPRDAVAAAAMYRSAADSKNVEAMVRALQSFLLVRSRAPVCLLRARFYCLNLNVLIHRNFRLLSACCITLVTWDSYKITRWP